MDLTKITLVSGATYIVSDSQEDVYQRITHSDGKPKDHMHLFTLENGQDMYINATYILSIEKVRSHMKSETVNDPSDDTSEETEEAEDKKRIKNNLEAVKEFKEDIDGNME